MLGMLEGLAWARRCFSVDPTRYLRAHAAHGTAVAADFLDALQSRG